MRTFPTARYARGLPTVSSCLYGEQAGDAELATLVSAPCSPYRTKPQPKLKPQLQHKLLRSLRSLRPRCLRSPCSEGANRSPRYARRTICTFFAFSGVWQLFVFCLLVRSSLKGRKPKQPRFLFAYGLHIPAWRAVGKPSHTRLAHNIAIQNHNSNSNHNCNTNSSARCARSGHPAYGLQTTTTQTQTTTATKTPPLASLAPATLPTVSMLRRSK